jgi:hypothetical protein
MAFQRKHAIWVMTICFTLFIACFYILSLPRDTYAYGIQVNGGNLGIEVSPTQALFSATNMAPGWQGSANLEVSNAGQEPFSYSLSAVLNSGDQTLLNVLMLQLQDKNGNTLYNGSMSNLQSLQLGTLNPGTNVGYTFTVLFSNSAGNQYQDKTGSVNFVFTAVSSSGRSSSGTGGGPVANTPAVQTLAATAVAVNSAVLNGSITGTSITEYGFLWSTNSNTLNHTLEVGADDHAGIFQANLGDLAVGTVYYFQAYARNANGLSRGDLEQFTTVVALPTVQTQIFPDIPATYWGYDAISNLSSEGYISGYPDGTFRPDNQITRAEFATIMDKVLKLTPYSTQTPIFTDVNRGDWFYQTVETSEHAGIFKGYGDGAFHPNAPISRQEIACVLVQAMGKSRLADSSAKAVTKFMDDHAIAWWSRGYAFVALQQGIVGGYPDGSFKPENETARAEACAMVSNFLKAYAPAK